MRRITPLAAFLIVMAGCSRSAKMQRGQQQYDVVQEGSASGVTSTINNPGETAAPVTETNADTTTNFTLPTNPKPIGNDTAGSTALGSLPPTANTPMTTPRPSRPLTETRGMASSSTDTAGSMTPPRERHAATPPVTDTSDTAATTDTAASDTATTTTSSDTKKKKDDGSRKSDDQQPPPPQPTDTTGTRG